MSRYQYRPRSDDTRIHKSPEQHLQEWYALYLFSKGVLYNASVSAVKVSIGVAQKMKRAGYQRGFPDIQILEPRGKWHGMFVELKVGEYARAPQRAWQLKLTMRGYYAIIVPGHLNYQEAQRFLEEETEKYLKGSSQ